MSNEQENIFLKNHIDLTEEYKKYGLDELDSIGRAKVWIEGRKRIGNTDSEEEKQKIFADLKQQYLEYVQIIKEWKA